MEYTILKWNYIKEISKNRQKEKRKMNTIDNVINEVINNINDNNDVTICKWWYHFRKKVLYISNYIFIFDIYIKRKKVREVVSLLTSL